MVPGEPNGLSRDGGAVEPILARVTGQTQQDRGQLLFVCTGNICRSPTAELLTKRELRRLGSTGPTVTSVGLNSLAGSPIDPAMASLLAADGIDPSSFRARDITQADALGAALILTATRSQKGEIAVRWPRTLPRTFTILEFIRLSSSVAHAPGRLDDLVAATASERAYGGVRAVGLDIADPHLRSRRAYDRCYRQLTAAATQIADAIGRTNPGPAATPGGPKQSGPGE